MDVQQMQARRAIAKRNAQAFRDNIARYRLDGRWLPDGQYEAILTVTLPDSHAFRFTSTVDPKQIARLQEAINPGVGSFFGDVWKGVKKVTKSVAQSKVFKAASTALAAAGPALGPLAPAAMAASTAMKMTTALTAARAHAANGNMDAASKLVSYAGKAANLGAAITVKAAAKGLPTSLKQAAASVKLAPKPGAKPAAPAKKPFALTKGPSPAAAMKQAVSVPLNRAMLDHAQAASAKIYTMTLRPA